MPRYGFFTARTVMIQSSSKRSMPTSRRLAAVLPTPRLDARRVALALLHHSLPLARVGVVLHARAPLGIGALVDKLLSPLGQLRVLRVAVVADVVRPLLVGHLTANRPTLAAARAVGARRAAASVG